MYTGVVIRLGFPLRNYKLSSALAARQLHHFSSTSSSQARTLGSASSAKAIAVSFLVQFSLLSPLSCGPSITYRVPFSRAFRPRTLGYIRHPKLFERTEHRDAMSATQTTAIKALPQEIWWLVSKELTDRRDFESLYNLARANRSMANMSLPLLYRYVVSYARG